MAVKTFSLKRIALTLAAALALSWLIGLVAYGQSVPEEIKDTTTVTDAIVVLTGGSGRVDEGIALLERGMSPRLFVSGVGRSVSITDILETSPISQDNLSNRIAIGSDAEDTPGNASETSKWVEQNNIHSIRLVTAAYHMPRSLLEFQYAMPNVHMVAHPVFPDQVKADWWKYPGTTSLLAREYTKYIIAYLRVKLGLAPLPLSSEPGPEKGVTE